MLTGDRRSAWSVAMPGAPPNKGTESIQGEQEMRPKLVVSSGSHVIDHKTIMWGSGFPHARCTYPNAKAVLERVFDHLDEAIRDDIVYRNCASFYNMELPG